MPTIVVVSMEGTDFVLIELTSRQEREIFNHMVSTQCPTRVMRGL